MGVKHARHYVASSRRSRGRHVEVVLQSGRSQSNFLYDVLNLQTQPSTIPLPRLDIAFCYRGRLHCGQAQVRGIIEKSSGWETRPRRRHCIRVSACALWNNWLLGGVAILQQRERGTETPMKDKERERGRAISGNGAGT